MQTSAISPMNFRGYEYSIDQEDIDYREPDIINLETELDKFDKAAELSTKLVDSKDVKSPFAAVLAITYAGIKSFVKGAGTVLTLEKFTGGKISGAFEKGLKKGSNTIKTFADKMTSKEGAKVIGHLGKAFEGGRKIAVNTYKKLSRGSSTRGLAFITGIITAASLLPGILKRDTNKDGVADIMQKSQNVYDKRCKTLDEVSEKTTVLTEMVQLLT